MQEETSTFNLFDFQENLAHQSSCAGIPQVDLLDPLGGEGHRGKGHGGNDHGGRQGDVLRSQGPLRQHQEEKGNLLYEGNVPWIFWVMFFEVHMVMSQLYNVEEANIQNIRNVEEVVKETIEAHVDFREINKAKIEADLEVKIIIKIKVKIICRDKNSVRNPK